MFSSGNKNLAFLERQQKMEIGFEEFLEKVRHKLAPFSTAFLYCREALFSQESASPLFSPTPTRRSANEETVHNENASQ